MRANTTEPFAVAEPERTRNGRGAVYMVALFTVLTVAIANLSHGRTQIDELFAVRDLILTNCSDRSSSIR
jgi:hypothetical protein